MTCAVDAAAVLQHASTSARRARAGDHAGALAEAVEPLVAPIRDRPRDEEQLGTDIAEDAVGRIRPGFAAVSRRLRADDDGRRA